MKVLFEREGLACRFQIFEHAHQILRIEAGRKGRLAEQRRGELELVLCIAIDEFVRFEPREVEFDFLQYSLI